MALQCCDECMADLVVGNDQFLFVGHDLILLLVSGDDNLNALLQIRLGDEFSSITDGTKCCLINNVGKLSTRCTCCCSRNCVKVNIVCNLNLCRMYLQNILTTLKIRQFNRNAAVKTARTKKCRVQGIRTVRRCQNDNAFLSIESIHLGKQLVQGLLTLVVSGESAAVTFFADGIDLIDKDDTRCFLICLLEQVTHLRSSHADEHLDKLRTGNGEERNICLSGYCLCKQRFTGSWRADKQCSFRHFCTNFFIFFGIMQEVNNLL